MTKSTPPALRISSHLPQDHSPNTPVPSQRSQIFLVLSIRPERPQGHSQCFSFEKGSRSFVLSYWHSSFVLCSRLFVSFHMHLLDSHLHQSFLTPGHWLKRRSRQRRLVHTSSSPTGSLQFLQSNFLPWHLHLSFSSSRQSGQISVVANMDIAFEYVTHLENLG